MNNPQEIITIEYIDPRYPEVLKRIGNDAPKTLYALGNIDLLTCEHLVAIIGARVVSQEGYNAAYTLAARLAQEGNVIVSGLALGCDTAAHRGCLSVGGKTIAIVASGLDLIYPRENASLQAEILDKGGLVLSEQPMGTKAAPRQLVARNRIQAGLSETVIVAECLPKSGTMHTVNFARKYSKQVRTIRFPQNNEMNSGNRHIVESGFGEYIDL